MASRSAARSGGLRAAAAADSFEEAEECPELVTIDSPQIDGHGRALRPAMLVPLWRFSPARLRLQPKDLRCRIALHGVLEQRLRHGGIGLRLPVRQFVAEMLAQRRFRNRLALPVLNETANHILPHPTGHEGFDKAAVLIGRGEGGAATSSLAFDHALAPEV